MPQLMEKILSPENMNTALKKVKSNKGAGGIDGIEMKDIDAYITANWAGIRDGY